MSAARPSRSARPPSAVSLLMAFFPRTNIAKALPGSSGGRISIETRSATKPMHGVSDARRPMSASKIYSIYQ